METFLDLGRQPLSNGFLAADQFQDEYFFDLKACFNTDTCMVSLEKFVDSSKMFNENYHYHASKSQTMIDHFASAASDIKELFNSVPTVLEIGSNDGIFIKNFDPGHSYCVEPCSNFAELTNSMGYKTYDDWWNVETSRKIVDEIGKVDVVYSASCMCHIPDVENAFVAVSNILRDGGLFVFQDPTAYNMILNNSYDQIYDEHAHIFSVLSLSKILNRCGLQIVNVTPLDVHGGSNRIYACKSGTPAPVVNRMIESERSIGLHKSDTYHRFADNVRKSREDLIQLLSELKSDGKKIISYGATSKSTVVFNYCSIGPDIIDYISDTTEVKQNKFLPGVHIPIVPQPPSIDDSVDYAFLGAWNYLDEISNKENVFLSRGGKFITHVPRVRVIGE